MTGPSSHTALFALRRSKVEQERRLHAAFPNLADVRAMPTGALKALWDSYDGVSIASPHISAEVVHFVLNERGEGDHCAV